MRIKIKKLSLLAASMFVASGSVVSPVVYGAENLNVLEEVVVTARKRVEVLRDVPAFVSALSQDSLDNAQIENAGDFIGKLPGISKSGDFFSPGKEFSLLVIRGVGANGGIEPAAPVYVDGVYLPRLGFDTDFLDVERVEVLFGPQSTLFGRNAEGGAVNIVSRRPNEEVRKRFQFEIDDFPSYKAQAAISGPISDKWFFGLALEGNYTEGFLTNIGQQNAIVEDNALPPGRSTLNFRNAADPDTGGSLGGRLALRYVPSDDFEAYLTVDGRRFRGGLGLPGVPQSCECYELDVDGVFDSSDENFGATLNLDFSFENFDLTSITGYRDISTSSPFDFDGGSLAGLEPGTPAIDFDATAGAAIPGVTNSLQGNFQDFRFDQDVLSQEIRLTSTTDGPLQWLVGAYYFEENLETDRNIDVLGGTGFPFITTVQDVSVDRDGWAVFGQVTYDITDKVQVTGGLRYSSEQATGASELSFETPLFADFGNQNNGGATLTSFDFDNVDYTASIRWSVTDQLSTYFTTSTAFKSGGFPLGPSGTLPADLPFEEETVTSYEVGFKTDLLGNRLSINASVFYIELEDQQVRTIQLVDGIPFGTTRNAASATNQGVNFDSKYIVNDNFVFTGSFAYTDAAFDEFRTEGENPLDFSGQRTRFVPEWTFNLGAEWTLPVQSKLFDEVSLYGNWQYIGDQIQGFDGISVDVQLDIEQYDLLNVGANFQINDDLKATLFVNNVADDYIETRGFNVFFFSDPGGANRIRSTLNPPRQIGLRLAYEF